MTILTEYGNLFQSMEASLDYCDGKKSNTAKVMKINSKHARHNMQDLHLIEFDADIEDADEK